MTNIHEIQKNKALGGFMIKYNLEAKALGGLQSSFNIFVPGSLGQHKAPILYYLAGLTCTEDTAPWKAGFLRDAAQERVALVFPDTSPRGAAVRGEDDSWDFGTGAGFYLNATLDPWSKYYNMYDFVINELPQALKTLDLPLDFTRESIFGHSMGGHGAISLYLRNPHRFRSASGFAPVLNPTRSAWGQKAFKGYLKGGLDEGKEWDSTVILSKMSPQTHRELNILIDYGDEDQFYKDRQLLPESFAETAEEAGILGSRISVRRQSGYDHSYYFISTFGPEHIEFHSKFLNA
ncbi:putative esterase D [Cantharellus anzutake]|uniref:putative esterase D n=1 Tax=Cantharellus anzutake TaxID=1750568 RepID=UPI001906D36E|nr:putative esterase D [Cantharellus anzutake]KAF8330436.1 putative esterase D [Cantharellus anzutake]